MADDVADGKLAGGDAWLKWDNHFLRADDGLTYVPFSVVIDEAPGAFSSVSMYVRVANHGEDASAGRERALRRGIIGFEIGAVPVSVPERQFVPAGTPTGGEASAALAMAHPDGDYQAKYPYEDVDFIDFAQSGARAPYVIRRALAVPGGDYDVYVSIRECDPDGKEVPNAKSAVLKRRLQVPAFATTALRTSSVILADEVRTLTSPLTLEDQAAHPYALGAVEIIPAADAIMASSDTLSLVFFVYNLAVDPNDRPDATVTYAFFQHSGAAETLFQRTAPQEFDAETLPKEFDFQAFGNQLLVSLAVLLSPFPEGGYRLQIAVTDNIAETTIVDNVNFIVMDRSGGQ